MIWFIGIVAVLVIGATAMLAAGRLGEMPELPADNPVPRLPQGDFDARSLAAVRFAGATRGYSKRQVDALLATVGADLRAAEHGGSAGSEVTADKIRHTYFDVVTGGYLMSQVDIVLEKLAVQFSKHPPMGQHVAPGETVEFSESSAEGQIRAT